MAYSLTAVERESVITFNAAEENADIYASDPVWIRKFDKLVEQNPEQFKVIQEYKCEGKIIAKSYLFPKRFLTIRTKDIVSTMTDEQRAEQAERMRQMRRSCSKTKEEVFKSSPETL